MKNNDIYEALINKKSDIDKAIHILENNKTDIMNINVNDFHNVMKNFSTQKRSPYYEKYLIKLFNMEKVSSSDNRGDAVDKNNKYYEFKISFENEAKNLNIRQIRLYQNIDYYLCIYFGEEKNNRFIFLLTKEEMQKEVKLQKFQYTHGVKSIQNKNKYNEFSLTINTNNKIFTRWKQEYLNIKLTELIKA